MSNSQAFMRYTSPMARYNMHIPRARILIKACRAGGFLRSGFNLEIYLWLVFISLFHGQDTSVRGRYSPAKETPKRQIPFPCTLFFNTFKASHSLRGFIITNLIRSSTGLLRDSDVEPINRVLRILSRSRIFYTRGIL